MTILTLSRPAPPRLPTQSDYTEKLKKHMEDFGLLFQVHGGAESETQEQHVLSTSDYLLITCSIFFNQPTN